MSLEDRPLWKRFPRGVVWFTAFYLMLAVLGAIWTGNREFLFYLVVMFVLIAGFSVAHRRVQFSSGVLWGLTLWGAAHMAGGLVPVPEGWPYHGTVPVLYSWWIIPGYLKYDHLVHAYGFGVTTLMCWEGLRAAAAHQQASKTLEPTPGLLLLCTTASAGFGAANEVMEFAAKLLLPKTNVGGYLNTGWDLVANLAGATAGAMLILFTYRDRNPNEK